MIILWIILWIVIIAAVIGIVAALSDIGKKSSHKPYGPYERFVKRFLDAFLSTGALIVFSPILLITAILVRVKLGSPVLFTQERPGKDEKIFKLYKFRTMTDEKGEDGKLLPDSVRLTPFGRKLRASSLDELPELINIAKGDMSIIGPRPLLVSYLPYYRGEERLRHSVRPGLSGLAQVSGRNFIDWDHRLAKDAEYVKHITFLGDFKIIRMTISQVIHHDNIAVDTADEGNLAEIRGKK